jgi:hypothetical protein
MKIRLTIIIPLIIAGCLISGCSPKARYERRLKHELASGVRYDSLFMGLYLGMPQKDFYTHCWDLNKKGLIKQGTGNASVEYMTKDELKYPATMNFYPSFSDDKISEMPVIFAYKGWAPWNKTLSSKNLQLDVLGWYKKIYGSGFMTVSHHELGDAYVKIDGNRRITIFTKDELHVWAVFTDMLAKKDTVRRSPVENIVKDTINTSEKK